MEPRRVTTLPANPAALALYGDVALSEHLATLAWADYWAGRLPLDEVWAIHRRKIAIFRAYMRLMTEGRTHHDAHRGSAVRTDDSGSGPRGVGKDQARPLVTCPRCARPLVGDFCGYCQSWIDPHISSIPDPPPSLNTSEGPC